MDVAILVKCWCSNMLAALTQRAPHQHLDYELAYIICIMALSLAICSARCIGLILKDVCNEVLINVFVIHLIQIILSSFTSKISSVT